MSRIDKKLKFIQKKIVLALFISSIKLISVWLCAFFCLIIPIRYGFNLSNVTFICLIGIWCIALCWVLVRYIGIPLRYISTIEKTARWIEKRIPLFAGNLISAVQFNDPDYIHKQEFSKELIKAHQSFTDTLLKPDVLLLYPQLLPSPQPANYWWILCLVLCIPNFFHIDFFADSIYHTYRDFFNPIRQPDEYLFVRPESTEVIYGHDLPITLFLPTPTQSEPHIHVRVTRGEWVVHPLERKTNYRFEFTIKQVENNIDYFVDAPPLTSQIYTIKPLIIPVILHYNLTVTPPAYTGWNKTSVTHQQFGDISTLRGSHVTMTIIANNPIKHADLILSDNESIEFGQIDNDNALIKFTLLENDTYTIAMTDTYGQSNIPLIPYKLIALPDKPPSISIQTPDKSIELPQSMRIDLTYSASDDIGIADIVLHYTVELSDKHKSTIASPVEPSINSSYQWDLTHTGIVPGENITYFLSVTDNCPPPDGPHKTITNTYRITFPSLAQIYHRQANTFDTPLHNFNQLKETHDTLVQQIKNIREKIAGEDKISWSDKQTLKSLTQSQQDIQDTVNQITQSIEDKIRTQQLATDVVNKFKQIQSISDSLLTDQMKEHIAKLQAMIEQSESFKQVQQQFDQMQVDLESYNEQLDRILSLMKKTAVENKLKEMFEATKSMLKNQDNLIKELNKSESNQSDIKKTLNSQKEFLEYLNQSMHSLPDQIRDSYDDLSDRFYQFQSMYNDQQLTQLLDLMRTQVMRSNRHDASQTGRKIQVGIQKTNASLSDFIQQIQQQRELLQNIVAVIDRIIMMKEQLYTLSVSIQRYHGKNKTKNIDHAKRMYFIEAELNRIGLIGKTLGKDSTLIAPDFYQEIFSISDMLKTYNEKLFKKGDMNIIPLIRSAQISLNTNATKWIKLLELIQKFNQQATSGQGAPKQGMGDFFDQLNQLATQQAKLNRQTGMLPGITPTIRPQINEYMKRLAVQQKMLAEALSSLTRSYNTSHRIMGDLEQISKQMDTVADQLNSQNVTPELIKRQMQIHTRLLEATKSMRIRGKSNERESKSGKQIDGIQSPKELDKSLLEQTREKILNRSHREYIPPAYRKLVEDYFRRLMQLQPSTPTDLK